MIVFETIAYASTTPRPREQFFQLYVLGANRLLADYYPNDDSNIRLQTMVRWYVGVTDFMGTVQFVEIRIKLGNQTIKPPDDLQAIPSTAYLVTAFRMFLQNNQTWEFPFFWQIMRAESRGNSTRLFNLAINNATYQTGDVVADSGHNFRIIIELWTWREQSGTWEFGWMTSGERRIAWLQLWFNMTTPGP
jgi:uncharacterized membrane protein